MHQHTPEGEPAASCAEPTDGAHGRRFVRYPVGLPCEFSSDHYSGKGKLIDLSTGGCKVEGTSRLTVGEYLSMVLQTLAPGHPLAVHLAVVRWASGNAFGVEFIRMEPAQQARFRLLVDYIEKDCAVLAKPGAGAALKRSPDGL